MSMLSGWPRDTDGISIRDALLGLRLMLFVKSEISYDF
jgi:hypothetical protein